jgi:hypothetical protein
MNRSTHAFVAAVVLALAPLGAVSADDPAPAGATAPVNAVWVDHEQHFVYFGRTTYYSCTGLREKVRYILERAGARPDFKVSTSCLETGGSPVESMPGVRIRAAFPAEATPEVLARLQASAPERELVARVQGAGERVDDATAQFPAVWRRVEFQGRGRGRIDDGDCELLEALVQEVFVPAGLRVAPGSRLGCVPHQAPVGSVDLVLEALQKVPEPGVPPTRG